MSRGWPDPACRALTRAPAPAVIDPTAHAPGADHGIQSAATLFKQGPSALARLIFFVVLALALLISDARFKTLEIVRGVLGAGLYPLQRAALVPRDIFMGAADLAVTSATLRAQNDELRKKNLQLSLQAQYGIRTGRRERASALAAATLAAHDHAVDSRPKSSTTRATRSRRKS
jgi:hypothetical protein